MVRKAAVEDPCLDPVAERTERVVQSHQNRAVVPARQVGDVLHEHRRRSEGLDDRYERRPEVGPVVMGGAFARVDQVADSRAARAAERLAGHAAKLAEVPSTAQITAAVEQLLAKTMASLDERLTTQAQSIEVLKTTVSQTDSLLERVLESLDSLQTYGDRSGLSPDVSFQQPTI